MHVPRKAVDIPEDEPRHSLAVQEVDVLDPFAWIASHPSYPALTFDHFLDIVAENPAHRHLWLGESFVRINRRINLLELFSFKRQYFPKWEDQFKRACFWFTLTTQPYTRENHPLHSAFLEREARLYENIPDLKVYLPQRTLPNEHDRPEFWSAGRPSFLCALAFQTPLIPTFTFHFHSYGMPLPPPLNHYEKLVPITPATELVLLINAVNHANEIVPSSLLQSNGIDRPYHDDIYNERDLQEIKTLVKENGSVQLPSRDLLTLIDTMGRKDTETEFIPLSPATERELRAFPLNLAAMHRPGVIARAQLLRDRHQHTPPNAAQVARERNVPRRNRLPEVGKHGSAQTDERQQALVAQLQAKGARFDVIPEDLPPGTPYITPLELLQSKATKYSQNRLLELARDETVPVTAHRLAGKTVFTASDLMTLFEHERRSETQPHPGSKPGQPKRRRVAV